MNLPVYTHPACMRHVVGPGHPECPERLGAVVDGLRHAWPDLDWREAPQALRSQLERVHAGRLIAEVLDVPTVGTRRLDADTAMNEHSAEAALRAAGAGVAAVDGALRRGESRAFCAVRPPGHHATAGIAMGFCLFNSIAVAAAHALHAHGLERVAIADFDVHHGNGTQAIFEHEPRVHYVSSHQSPLYPDSGFRSERGVGNVLNAPLPPGADGAAFRRVWHDELLPALEDFRPQLVLISAGFDAHHLDPLADLGADSADFAWLTTELVALAGRHAQGRALSMLEGGYSLSALREAAVAHVGALAEA
ncbi:histone deacetylase family protein [Coralloluteibacterium stylophorae]|uniref:Histone deacetylase family protein n=1 Tax=Coralloluteibacterium stylophorae TaxID=1776034 RepID=A0A8J7VTV3_9GAMM|nr:histone deacetylase family protein [Coralloluteibacterium stylophorae]MBS7456123.1 histone deacetylase family protein [Coralloluteibacterium stylophorae]